MFIKANKCIVNVDIKDITCVDYSDYNSKIYVYYKGKDKVCEYILYVGKLDIDKVYYGLLNALSRNAKSIDLDRYKKDGY